MDATTFHVAMYPWFGLGHITSFLHISNKLAERGHKISFFIPTNTQSKMNQFNLHPHLISFIPITLPHVDGLPPGSETTSDLPFPLHSLLVTSMDLTQPHIEACLGDLKPDFVFFDFTHWLPSVARGLGIKTIHYCTISPVTVGYLISPERKLFEKPLEMIGADIIDPPPSFPPSAIRLRPHEARGLARATLMEYGKGVSFLDRNLGSFLNCDAIAFKTCREMEGPYCDYIETQMEKQVFLAGPVLPKPPASSLEEKWENWLGNFKPKSVIFCAFGSECALGKDQFQELVLGLELTAEGTIESALPEGFIERTKDRGVVQSGWVQQQLILNHPSVGCFVTHCGSGSLTEAMVNECQLVLLPYAGDQFINARFMSGDLKVGVEVERGEEDGLFTKEGVCKAVRDAMEEESEVGQEIRRNHSKWREFLFSEGLENSYVDAFVQKLHDMLES
ncbi:anthocyanidin 3-O-glucoside 2''-O-glucosyltransferase-like [Senna tora]|uniref:Glycosyltransferase n=1 Tax=Senna tora TaxID=362788 RepID=A0A834W2F7_9FABA|nr:anthocyanidin 3-O-glucoside 2''-O-glucosyltransferase-like [Senna tora]